MDAFFIFVVNVDILKSLFSKKRLISARFLFLNKTVTKVGKSPKEVLQPDRGWHFQPGQLCRGGIFFSPPSPHVGASRYVSKSKLIVTLRRKGLCGAQPETHRTRLWANLKYKHNQRQQSSKSTRLGVISGSAPVCRWNTLASGRLCPWRSFFWLDEPCLVFCQCHYGTENFFKKGFVFGWNWEMLNRDWTGIHQLQKQLDDREPYVGRSDVYCLVAIAIAAIMAFYFLTAFMYETNFWHGLFAFLWTFFFF